MKKRNKFQVLSPDGFTIEFDKPHYPSRKKAIEAYEKWKSRYEQQGYYSSAKGRIPLDELDDNCSLIII